MNRTAARERVNAILDKAVAERTDDILHARDALELMLTSRPRPTVDQVFAMMSGSMAIVTFDEVEIMRPAAFLDHFGDEGLTMAQKRRRQEVLSYVD